MRSSNSIFTKCLGMSASERECDLWPTALVVEVKKTRSRDRGIVMTIRIKNARPLMLLFAMCLMVPLMPDVVLAKKPDCGADPSHPSCGGDDGGMGFQFFTFKNVIDLAGLY